MPNWQEVQHMMRDAKTPQEKAEALRALQDNVPADMQDVHMVTMSKGSDKNNIKLADLDLHAGSDEVFERLKNLTIGKSG